MVEALNLEQPVRMGSGRLVGDLQHKHVCLSPTKDAPMDEHVVFGVIGKAQQAFEEGAHEDVKERCHNHGILGIDLHSPRDIGHALRDIVADGHVLLACYAEHHLQAALLDVHHDPDVERPKQQEHTHKDLVVAPIQSL